MGNYCVYLLTNMENNKEYVGITTRLAVRFAEHRYNAKTSRTKGNFVGEAVDPDRLTIRSLHENMTLGEAKELEAIETEQRNTLSPNGYNRHHPILMPAKGVSKGRMDAIRGLIDVEKRDARTKQMGLSNKGAKRSPEFCARRSEYMKTNHPLARPVSISTGEQFPMLKHAAEFLGISYVTAKKIVKSGKALERNKNKQLNGVTISYVGEV